MIVLVGIFVGILVYVMIGPPIYGKKKSRMAAIADQAYQMDEDLDHLEPKSLNYQLQAAGIDIKPATFRLLNIMGAMGVLILMWLLLPGVPAIAIAGIAYIAPGTWLKNKLKNRGWEIDKLLPMALGRIANSIQTGMSIPDALDNTARILDHEGKNPLSPELTLTASEMRTKEDRSEALLALARRSPSISLANTAYLLRGAMESGGSKYNLVLVESADRIRKVIAGRNAARAKANESMITAVFVPAILVFVLISLSQSPVVKQSLHSFLVQIVLGIAFGAMIIGYFIIKNIVDDAV